MPQRSGIDGKTDYGERGCNRAVEKGKPDGVGAESKWNQGKGAEENCKNLYM